MKQTQGRKILQERKVSGRQENEPTQETENSEIEGIVIGQVMEINQAVEDEGIVKSQLKKKSLEAKIKKMQLQKRLLNPP